MGETSIYSDAESVGDGVQAAIIAAHLHWEDLKQRAFEDKLPLTEMVRKIVSKAKEIDPNLKWGLGLSEIGNEWELHLISEAFRGGVGQGRLASIANNFEGNLRLVLNFRSFDEEES